MQQLYGTVGDTLSSVAPGTWLCAVAAVVNLALLLVMHADLDRTDGMAFSRHGVVFVIFTLATSALSCVIPGGAGFFFTFSASFFHECSLISVPYFSTTLPSSIRIIPFKAAGLCPT